MSNDLHLKAVEELAPMLENKEISPVELTKEILDVAERSQPIINSYIEIYREEALQDAKIVEKEILDGQYKGLYHGIPLALKDNLYFKGKVTTMASEIHKDFVSDVDATVVEKLKNAGVIYTGKLNMHEYAWGATTNNPHFGPVKNPWDLEKIPGGSSGGSGAAVASGASVASLGTDTGGSIRIPSSACGIVGLKPTHGRVSKYGCFPLAWSLDHIGPMTKTIKDAAAMLEVIAGYDYRDPTCIDKPVENYLQQITGDVKDLIIGIEEDYFFNNVDNDVEQAVRQQIQYLINQGARVETIKLPSLQNISWAMLVTIISEASAIHHKNLQLRPQDFGDDVRLLLELGELPSAVDFLHAQQIRQQIKQDFNNALSKVDVIISPTLPIVPNEIGNPTADLNGEQVDLLDNIIRFTGASNLTGLPALSVPAGFKNNLPVGMQIIGRSFQEGLILNVGYAVEQNNPLQSRRPDIFINV